jgi:hypothetical protein
VGSETGRRTPKIESIRNVVLARCGSGTRWRDTLTGHIVGILCASSIGSEIGQLAVATVDVYHCGALRARCGCRLGPILRKRPTIPAAEPINPPWVVDIENRFAGEERENLRLKKVEPPRSRCKTCRTGARCVQLVQDASNLARHHAEVSQERSSKGALARTVACLAYQACHCLSIRRILDPHHGPRFVRFPGLLALRSMAVISP